VTHGKRPTRPSTDIRGLNDKIWNLVTDCWDKRPNERPTAQEITECLLALPNQPLDSRLSDNITSSFPSQILYPQADHPFPPLALTDNHRDVVCAWKWSEGLDRQQVHTSGRFGGDSELTTSFFNWIDKVGRMIGLKRSRLYSGVHS
jgi:hypothetical protein